MSERCLVGMPLRLAHALAPGLQKKEEIHAMRVGGGLQFEALELPQ
jgi:hypothetical protein